MAYLCLDGGLLTAGLNSERQVTRPGPPSEADKPGPDPVRASAGPDGPVHHPDVGRVFVLRPAGAAGLLHDQASGVQPGQVLADLRCVRRRRILQPVLRRVDRRPLAGPDDQRDHRRGDDDGRPFRDGVRKPTFPGAGAGRARQRPLHPAARDPGRQPLRRRRPAQGLCLFDLLYGHQSRRPARALVCGTLGEIYGWHWGFAAAGVGMAIGLVDLPSASFACCRRSRAAAA